MNTGPSTLLTGFAGKPDAKASELLWRKISAMSSTKMQPSKSPQRTPVAKRTRNKLNKSVQKSTLTSSGWIDCMKKKNGEETLKDKYCKNPKQKKRKINNWVKNKTENKTTLTKSKPVVERMDSGSGLSEVGLPSFNEVKKPKKPSKKSKKENEGYKRYGVILPTFDDIINERKNYEEYKTQVESAQTLKEPKISLSFSPLKNNNRFEVEWLDCKNLTEKEITKFFNDNTDYLDKIKSGKKFSERHQRYHDKKNQVPNKMTTKDLTYNTSMIVFTFEQIDQLVGLLRQHFDPDDIMSDYFFKVLVPELCLKIFMDCHGMEEAEAIEYLDERPVE